ncbi:low molecular weight protein-tyrosine-phosphatase [Neptunomonas japonica]|uniref:low molecular weight protein-tyrosine-phosphatase n=1 Tax=Neptunomonas japonica TaxID=417574 RepID=UPI0024811B4D|nr:low molecular weight protein-tyrosine-phosphatase [Neptunomonas japonica]
MVCMENICRSPILEGVLKKALAEQGLSGLVRVDSAGTYASQPGSKPDVRAVKVAREKGVDISRIRSRRVKVEDYDKYDYIIAVDDSVLQFLNEDSSGGGRCQIRSLVSFMEEPTSDQVPDPYYGNAASFQFVYDLIEKASEEIALFISNDCFKK